MVLDAVNQAFDHPPLSTEQVMHPDKYLNGEVPRRSMLPVMAGPLGPGWLKTDTLGVLYLRMLIEQYADSEEAVVAAAGWGGDIVELLEDEAGRLSLVLASPSGTPKPRRLNSTCPGACIACRFGVGCTTRARPAVAEPLVSPDWRDPLPCGRATRW